MENTTLGFLKGKCIHGFLPDKPSRRHNGPQNAPTVSRGINPFQTLTPHSQPLQCPQNKSQRIMPLIFFIFGKFFVYPYLHEIPQSHVTILFCYRRFFRNSELSEGDFFVLANRREGNPARSWPRISPAGHGIAARSTPKQRKKRTIRCAFHTKHAIFHS